MVYKFCVINHKTLEDRGMLERNQILERRRGKELDLYGARVGSSTCITAAIAEGVRSNKAITLTRSERRLGASLNSIRHKYQMRQAYTRWRKAILRAKHVVLSDGDRKLKFFLSLWNFKANRERIQRRKEEQRKKARRARKNSSSSEDSSCLYKLGREANKVFPSQEAKDDEDEENSTLKDRLSSKHKIMNIATAMATLGMANTRGLEDPSVGPMLLSHAFQSRVHLLEESRAFAIIHKKKQEWYHSLPTAARSQKQTNTRNKYRRYARYTTEHVRRELIKIHDAYQCIRKKYEGKYSTRVPTASFKGNYGNLKGGLDTEKPSADMQMADGEGITSDKEVDQLKKPYEDSKAGDLFRKKGLAIGKLAAMNFVSSKDKARMKEEQDKNNELFRKKREMIKKEQEDKKRLSTKMNKMQEELLGILGEGQEIEDKKKKKRDMDELSVSSGDGEIFIHNLMGFWT